MTKQSAVPDARLLLDGVVEENLAVSLISAVLAAAHHGVKRRSWVKTRRCFSPSLIGAQNP
jgi:hypothetical protein